MKNLILASLLLGLVFSELVYTKVQITDPAAKCLDGSAPAYYIYPGAADKVLLFFEGGGWCGDDSFASTLQNCYQRSKTDLGSSTKYGATQSFYNGILSDNKDNYFIGWTRVFLKYCTGTGHQGTKAQPVLYKGAQIFFRGHNVTVAQLASVDKTYGIFSGKITSLVLTGESAGGLATFSWTNYIASKVQQPTKFWSMPDSGVFVDFPNVNTKSNQYRIWFQNLMRYSNEQIGTPTAQCNKAYPGDDLWKCMFAQYLHPFIKTPIFAPQSLYDSWSLYNIVGLRCVNGYSLASCSKENRDTAQEYKKSTLQVMFEISSRNENAVWAPVCINHCYLSNEYYSSPNYRIPMNTNFSLISSVSNWLEGKDESGRHIDFGSWPMNSPCSGLSMKRLSGQ